MVLASFFFFLVFGLSWLSSKRHSADVYVLIPEPFAVLQRPVDLIGKYPRIIVKTRCVALDQGDQIFGFWKGVEVDPVGPDEAFRHTGVDLRAKFGVFTNFEEAGGLPFCY